MRQSSGAAVKNGPEIHAMAPVHTGRPSDRCQERGCPYPSAAPGGWCRVHGAIRTGKIARSQSNNYSERNAMVERYAR